MADNLNDLQMALTLWTNIAHKLWEARSTLLPKSDDHTHGLTAESSLFTPEILAVYDGLDDLYMEAEKKKQEESSSKKKKGLRRIIPW